MSFFYFVVYDEKSPLSLSLLMGHERAREIHPLFHFLGNEPLYLVTGKIKICKGALSFPTMRKRIFPHFSN